MLVRRSGSDRYEGDRDIALSLGTLAWDSTSACVTASDFDVLDFYGHMHHHYTLHFDSEEILRLASGLANEATRLFCSERVTSLSQYSRQLRRLSVLTATPRDLGFKVKRQHGVWVDESGKQVVFLWAHQGWIKLGSRPQRLVVLKLDATGGFRELYNGSGLGPRKAAGKPDENGLRSVRVSGLGDLRSRSRVRRTT